METIAQANLWLRTASRVIVRVASFRAQAFHELERLARAVPWERFVAAGGTVRFRVTSKKSRLYHTDAIAQRCVTDPNLTLFGSNYQDVFAFLVLITVLVFRPSGLLGERVSDRA